MIDWEGKELLLQSFLSLENREEAEQFLVDLLTEKEINEVFQRLCAARMLLDEVSYTEIAEKTKLSSATIARAARMLKEGEGGSRAVLDRIRRENENFLSQ